MHPIPHKHSFHSNIKVWCHKHNNINLSHIILKIKVIIKVDKFLKIKINLVKFIISKIQDSQLKSSIKSHKVIFQHNSKCTQIKIQTIKDNNKAIIKIILNNKIITNKITNKLTQKKISTQIKIPNFLKIQTTTTFKVKANNNNLYKIQQLTKKNLKIIVISIKQVSLKNHSKIIHLKVS